MSRRRRSDAPLLPDDTAQVAWAAFPRGNPYLLLCERLGAMFQDSDLSDPCPALCQPVHPPWRLVTAPALPREAGRPADGRGGP